MTVQLSAIFIAFGIGLSGDIFISNKIRKRLAAQSVADAKAKKHINFQFKILLPLLIVILTAPTFPVSQDLLIVLRRTISILFVFTIAWISFSMVFLARQWILSRYDMNVSDNLAARSVHTQVNVLVKIFLIVITVLALTAIIMMFDNIRQLGASILASAGVMGIVVGFAAQKSIAALLAGLQIAITQPIRIDDVVIVEGEWGRIEEITLTYVVVRIWDLRRLVVPSNYFLENPFQNWTRVSANLLATITLHADYTIPVDAIRNKLLAILEESPYWDGQVWKLHVTDATNKTVELRALMSAADSSSAWELRCEVREKILNYVQKNFPDKLPKIRAEFVDPRTETFHSEKQ